MNVLLLALAAIVLCLLAQVATIFMAIRYFSYITTRKSRLGAVVGGFLRISNFMIVLMVGVILQVAVWAALYVLLDLFDDVETALYFSGVTFTSLGYGEIVLPKGVRMLAPIEAATGLLMFGITTAVLIGAMQYGLKATSEETRAKRRKR